jgi:hypothetical protein
MRISHAADEFERKGRIVVGARRGRHRRIAATHDTSARTTRESGSLGSAHAFDPSDVPLVVAFVALFVGLLGAGMSAAAILQKHHSDKRDALWNRSQVAIALSQSDKPTERELGTNMINMLLDQNELDDNDADLLQLAAQAAMVEGEVLGAGADEVAAIEAVRREAFDDLVSLTDSVETRHLPALDSHDVSDDDGTAQGGRP